MALLTVFHRCVRAREHEPLMPVVVADKIWRCAVCSTDLDDFGYLVRGADNACVYVQPVSHNCPHANPSPELCPKHGPFPMLSEELGAFLDQDQTWAATVVSQASTLAGASLTAANCAWV